jgi:hypothetical protein
LQWIYDAILDDASTAHDSVNDDGIDDAIVDDALTALDSVADGGMLCSAILFLY